MADPVETPKSTLKKGTKPPLKKKETFSCGLCRLADTKDMVQCDVCDLWFHFKCVSVDESMNDNDWTCENCTNAKNLQPNTSRPKSTSHRSIAESSQSKRLRQRDLQLQRLEEERVLAEKREKEAQSRQKARDKEYMEQRFQILMNEDTEHDLSGTGSISPDHINNWIQEQSNEAGKRHGSVTNELPIQGQTAPRPFNDGKSKCVHQPKNHPLLSNSEFVFNSKVDPVSKVFRTKPNNWHDDGQGKILTSDQIAARQTLPKELPSFSGNPEDWPIFISSFESSNKVCGFSNVENLIRLQRCLKGRALEDVRSRLLLPSNVPSIIETLKMRYGRPELIIQILLQKVKDEPNPKSEKLETIVSFSLAVENLCSTMEACGMFAHLNNPILLQELIEKLPAQIKLNWALYSCNVEDVNLATLSRWLMQLANTVSSVTYMTPQSCTKIAKSSRNERAHVGVHDQDVKTTTKLCRICGQSCSKVEDCSKFNQYTLKDRWNAVKQNRLCRLCLFSHLRSRCRLNKTCGINGCTFKHHRLLHTPDENNIPTAPCYAHDDSGQGVFFRILPVNVYGKNGPIKVFVFFDEGSSVSLMDESLAKELQLQGQPEPLCLKWTGDTHRIENYSQVVSLQLSSERNTNKKFTVSNVRTVSALKLPTQSICMEELILRYPYLKGIPISSYSMAVPRILIGLNNWKLGVQLKFKEGAKDEPVASKTRLGWTLYGPYRQKSTSTSHMQELYSFHHCDCKEKSERELHDMMKQYFSLDSLGVSINSPKSTMSLEDQRALELIEAKTKRRGDHFETCLLWKYNDVKLPNSFPMALRRFKCLQSVLNRDLKLKNNLQNQIKEYEKKNYIRKLKPEELKVNHPRTWYLPIFAVRNINKPAKVRIVWDGAAMVDGISLNSVLLKGPDQLTSLLGVLHRFRQGKFAICGDISEMFHQIYIQSEDQHSQRFLWSTDATGENPDVYVMQVMTFGSTCSPSCAQYVKNKNAAEFANKYPRAVKCIVENHYVDDLLDSVDTESEAIQLGREVKWIHQRGSFEIGKWLSNSPKVISELGDGASKNKRNLNMETEIQADKVLGMWWNTSTDCFTFIVGQSESNQQILNCSRKPTKREILRILMSIYDPLGLIAHFLIYLKILIQDLWKEKIGWDEQISDDHFTHWCHWVRMLDRIEELSIPRCYLSAMKFSEDVTTELHVFVDASKHAFAAVAYFRCSTQDKVECKLVGSKTRVSSIKLISIPRLELEAARLGVRLAISIIKEHTVKISAKVFWSDSKTVLSWIRANHRNYRQFVIFRVAEILELSKIENWRYVPTKMNVADEGTKWQKHPVFESSSRWFTGPQFLLLPKHEWPEDSAVTETSEESIRPHFNIQELKSEAVIDVSRFTSWLTLRRSQVYVFRFIFNCRCSSTGTQRRVGYITKEEYKRAETYLYRQAQLDVYLKEILKLTTNQNSAHRQQVIDKSSPIYELSPYIDEDGVLRSHGRIDAACAVKPEVKRPIILPRNHPTCRLIIQSMHEKFHHQQSETVVNELRQRFWIPRIRSAVKDVIKNCQKCKNRRSCP